MSSAREAESEGIPISLAEVVDVGKKPICDKAPGLNEIYPQTLKALDIVGVSWLDTPLQCHMQVGYSTLCAADRVGGSHHQEGQRVCPSYCSITLLSLPGNAYPRMLEKKL